MQKSAAVSAQETARSQALDPTPRPVPGDVQRGAARLRVVVPSVADRVADELRLQLAEGVLLPGERLTESTIAEDLGVSRNTVREAFAELAGERLVVRHPNRGVFVASLDAADIHDVYTVRRVIEVS
ncbi:gluconate operon transcriptional repressor, partial [Arthrobacter sp. Hiyo6]